MLYVCLRERERERIYIDIYILGPKCKPPDRSFIYFCAELTGIKCSSSEIGVNPDQRTNFKTYEVYI